MIIIGVDYHPSDHPRTIRNRAGLSQEILDSIDKHLAAGVLYA